MPFLSPTFLFAFLPAVLLGCLFCHKVQIRNVFLLIVSLFFYAWGVGRWALVLLFAIISNYAFGFWIYRSQTRTRARIALATAILINLAPLAIFKYLGFTITNLNTILRLFGVPMLRSPEWLPPAGISFFTFMAMSYLIALHRREVEVQRDPVRFGLFVSMFPLIMAGPICRYNHIAPQLINCSVGKSLVADGVRRFVFGLAKKTLIADALAAPTGAIFSATDLPAGVAWFGLACYSIQIYFDFSAYSDMAIGIGRMLGFRFMENFDYPYTARSLRAFWTRWHISLSTWFRDYVFLSIAYPASRYFERFRLPRLRGDFLAYSFASILTMLLIGFWHGASWTFVAWGLYHGSILILERTRLGKLLSRLPPVFQHIYALTLIMGGWVLFKVESLDHALSFLTSLLGLAGGSGPRLTFYATPQAIFILIVGAVLSTRLVPKTTEMIIRQTESLKGAQASSVRGAIGLGEAIFVAALLFLSALEIAGGTYRPFIYFQF